jgi:hypothetical protein
MADQDVHPFDVAKTGSRRHRGAQSIDPASGIEYVEIGAVEE